MAFSQIFSALRQREGLSQNEIAQRLFVTRQAVSRWERGETTPNLETLQRISNEFRVSINTLLGNPQTLVCQSCGMPLDFMELRGTEKDGRKSDDYCMYCYKDGHFTYECTMQQMIDLCVPHMANGEESFTHETAEEYLKALLPSLKRWNKQTEK